jgi:hypothetical protein
MAERGVQSEVAANNLAGNVEKYMVLSALREKCPSHGVCPSTDCESHVAGAGTDAPSVNCTQTFAPGRNAQKYVAIHTMCVQLLSACARVAASLPWHAVCGLQAAVRTCVNHCASLCATTTLASIPSELNFRARCHTTLACRCHLQAEVVVKSG